MSQRMKQILFSIDHFVILIAWLVALFAIFYFEAYEFIIPSIVAFIILNLAIGFWLHRFIYPVQNKSYRQYLTIQTLFFLVWSPVLAFILNGGRTELVSMWIAIMLVFYFGIGALSIKSAVLDKGRK